MNFRTYSDLAHIISNNLYKIPLDVDLVVGVPKSGLMVASMLALHLNLPLTDIDSLLEGKIYNSGRTKKRENWIDDPSHARKILLVEDSSASGKSFKEAKEKIKSSRYEDKIIFLIIFVNEKTKDLPDLYFDICPMPRMFEWNYMHHPRLENACVDIDGVLCKNPTHEEDDDGEKYIDFITNVKPRVIPTKKIAYIVSSRLEKYRPQTEAWLKKYNIKYDNLLMLDLPTHEDRTKLKYAGIFKGETYKKLKDVNIFIESSARQSEEIANISGKTVFCVDNSKVYQSKDNNQ